MEARTALEGADGGWQQEGTLFWAGAPQAPAGEGGGNAGGGGGDAGEGGVTAGEGGVNAGEGGVVVRTTSGEERARATLQRQVEQARQTWEKQLWHLRTQRFACEPDAQAALAQQLKKCPAWLVVHSRLIAQP